jgi:hypothetical protein
VIRIIPSEPVTDPNWVKWRCDAGTAAIALCRAALAGKPVIVNDNLYKRMKIVLFKLYYEKCVYCEAQFLLDQPGDVEHFRPKGRITNLDGSLVMLPPDSKIPHPGYYWLAYDWRNLFPSCIFCNRPNTLDTVSFGKWDKFPVNGVRAVAPGDEAVEEYLLLHPIDDEPEDHLSFESDGTISFKTPRGDACIALFGLNVREPLVIRRHKAWKEGYRAVFDLFEAIKHDNEKEADESLTLLQRIRIGAEAYSAAARRGVASAKEKLQRRGIIMQTI